MERFSLPGVGGIIEKEHNGDRYILIQERWNNEWRNNTKEEMGLIEIPAGKIREFENIYECLKREIKEETGLNVVKIEGEKEAEIVRVNGYEVLNYKPFASSQNLRGSYPIMVQIFICKVEGELLNKSKEAKNMQWISLKDLKEMLNQEDKFYPMHITTLYKYLEFKGY